MFHTVVYSTDMRKSKFYLVYSRFRGVSTGIIEWQKNNTEKYIYSIFLNPPNLFYILIAYTIYKNIDIMIICTEATQQAVSYVSPGKAMWGQKG